MAADLLSGIAEIFSSGLLWVFLSLIVIYFIVNLWLSKKGRPEEQAFWGDTVRKEVTNKKTNNRLDVWGIKGKRVLYRGMDKIGSIAKVETFYRNLIPKGKGKDEVRPEEFYLIAFTKPGIMGWINGLLNKYEKLVIAPDCISVRQEEKKTRIIVDPLAFINEQSGIWTINRSGERRLVEDINLALDNSNLAGFISDHPRRLSSIHPAHSQAMDALETNAKIEKQKKEDMKSSWSKG